jgi:hypothetical protein
MKSVQEISRVALLVRPEVLEPKRWVHFKFQRPKTNLGEVIQLRKYELISNVCGGSREWLYTGRSFSHG